MIWWEVFQGVNWAHMPFYCRKALTMRAPNSCMDRVTPSGGKGGDGWLQREDFMNSSMLYSPTTDRTPRTRHRMPMTSSADHHFTRRSCSAYLRAQQLMMLPNLIQRLHPHTDSALAKGSSPVLWSCCPPDASLLTHGLCACSSAPSCSVHCSGIPCSLCAALVAVNPPTSDL